MDENDEHRNGDSPPEGTYSGTKAKRQMVSAEGMRRFAEEANRRVVDYGGFSDGASYERILDPGKNPTDVFARTEYFSLDEVKETACAMALSMETLKNDPRWQDEEWVKSEDPEAAYYYFEALGRMSLYRQSRKEGTLGETGFVTPDVWKNAGNRNG